MSLVVFNKQTTAYTAHLKSPLREEGINIILDTGSPITILSIPTLLALTKIPKFRLIEQIVAYKSKHTLEEFSAYGNPDISEKNKYKFIPYIAQDIYLNDSQLKYFIFWLDVTPVINGEIIISSSNLFGYDYVKYCRKSFDDEDNFCIDIDKEAMFKVAAGIEYALSNIHDRGIINHIEIISTIKDNKFTFQDANAAYINKKINEEKDNKDTKNQQDSSQKTKKIE